MQDRYAGDVGDFGKYGLLRHLKEEKQLGVVWYRYPSETGNEDGRYIGYLEKQSYRGCDADLHDALAGIVGNNQRTVAAVEASGVLGVETSFFSETLDYSHFDSRGSNITRRQERLAHRDVWLGRAIGAMEGCEVIFLDPDNGLEVPSTAKHVKKGPKFVFKDELQRFASIDGVDSVVLYHHLNRHSDYGSHEQQMADRMNEIIASVGQNIQVAGLRYHPYSPRAFFVICMNADEHKRVQASIRTFLQLPWNRYFTSH